MIGIAGGRHLVETPDTWKEEWRSIRTLDHLELTAIRLAGEREPVRCAGERPATAWSCAELRSS